MINKHPIKSFFKAVAIAVGIGLFSNVAYSSFTAPASPVGSVQVNGGNQQFGALAEYTDAAYKAHNIIMNGTAYDPRDSTYGSICGGYNTFAGNGSTATFNYTIPFTGSSSTDNTNFMVFYEPTNGSGSATVLNTSQFTVTGVNSGVGGTITLNSAPPSGNTLIVVHDDAAGIVAAATAGAATGGYVVIPDGCTIYGSQANGTQLPEGAQLIGQSYTQNYGFQGQGTKPIMRVIAPTGAAPAYGLNISGKSQIFSEGFEITSNVSSGLAALGFLTVPVLMGANTAAGAGGGQNPGIVVQYMTFNSGKVGFGSPIGGSSNYIFSVIRFSNFTANTVGIYGPLSDQQLIGNDFSANGAFGSFGSAGGVVIGPQQGAPGASGAARFEFNRFEFNQEGIVVQAAGTINMEGNQFDGNSNCGLDIQGTWSNINITGGWFHGNGNGGGSFRGTTTAGRDAHICVNSSANGQGLTLNNVDFLTNYNVGNTAPIGSPNATTPVYILDMVAAGASNDYLEFKGGMGLGATGSNGGYITDFAIFRNGRPPHYKVDMAGQAVQGALVNGKLKSQARGLPTNSWASYDAFGDNVTYYSFYTASSLYPFLLNGDLVGSLTNQTTPFGFDCDIVDQNIFPNYNPVQTGNPLVTWLPAVVDPTYGNPAPGVVEPLHRAITQQCRIAGLTWMSIPSTYKIYGQNAACVQAGGTSWTNSSQYGGVYGIVSHTSGDAVTCSITSNGGPVYFWYGLVENDGGTFTYSIDGGTAVTLPTNGNNSFSFPVTTHTSVGGIRLPVLTAGSHSVTFTVSSATDAANTVTVYGLGTPPGKSYLGGNPTVFEGGQLYELNDSPYPTASATYNTDQMSDAYQLHADGLAVNFVDVRKYVNSTTDMTGGASYLVPNSTGQIHIKDAFEGEIQFLPNQRSAQVDPRSYGAACNAKNFINTFGSPNNSVTTTSGSPVISIANYTFVAGVATQTGGGDVGKVISVFGNGADVGPTTYIASVDTGANTATLGINMAANHTGAFAVMGGYPSNPNDPSTAQDDTVAIQNASTAAVASGEALFLPNNCLVHSLKLANGTLMQGSMGGVDYNSGATTNIPATALYCASNGFAEDPHTCINLAGTHNVRLKDFHLQCTNFPFLGFSGQTLAGVGSESSIALNSEGVVLDHLSFFLCPVEFGIPFGINQPVGFTASIAGTTMTVTSIDTSNFSTYYGPFSGSPVDWLGVGRPVTGSGVPANTKIVSSAIAGGVGTYTLNNSATVSSESMTSAAVTMFLTGIGRFNQFSNGGIDINGDFSDFADTGSIFTGGFHKCLWLGPNTGGSTGNGANRFALERFEECNNGAIVLDGSALDQFTGLHFQFNSGYAIETKNTWTDEIVTGGTFQGNASSNTPAPVRAQIALGGTGSNFSVVGSEWAKTNFSAGGTSSYLIGTTSGSNVDYVSIEGGDARTGFQVGTQNWVGNTPTHYKLTVPGIALVDTTQTTLSYPTTGGVSIGRLDSAATLGQLELGKPGTTQGQLMIDGSTSGTVNVKTAAAAGAWTLTLPTTAGTNTYMLTTDGSGITTWTAQPLSNIHPNVFAIFGTLTVANDQTNWVILPAAGTINKAWAVCKTGPTGQALIFDIQKSTNNGTSFTSIWNSTPANRIQIAAGQVAGTQTSFDTTSFNAGDLFRVDVDQIGSGAAGANCTVQLVSAY